MRKGYYRQTGTVPLTPPANHFFSRNAKRDNAMTDQPFREVQGGGTTWS